MATNTDGREEIKPVAPTEQTKWRDPSLVGKYMVDPKTGLAGLFRSPDNGETWVLTDTVYGHVYNQDEVDNIWDNGAGHKVADEVKSATADLPNVRKQADEAVKFAESAIAASKVNSDAIVAQSEAISEAKSAMDSATAEIQQTAANAASDAAKIRADVARVQNEVDTAKAANSASVDALKSDINTAKKDLANVHDSLTKAQAAAEQNQKAINDSIAEINANVDATNQDLAGVRKDLTKAQSDIAANQKSINDNVAQINADITQDRKDIASAQQANADTAKQLDDYSKQATEQGKTIKTIQDKQNSFTATLADVQGNVSQVSDKVSGLSANLKGAQDNVASVKAQADQLSATLTDHAKSIATLTASARELSSTLEDADGRLNKVEQTAQTNSSTLSDVQGNLSQVKQQADGLVSTLKDAQGNISTLQQKTDSVSAQLTTAQGDIATLQTGVDSVKATLTSHDKSIHTLQADSKSLKDSMVNAQGDISTLRKTATDVTSELEDHTGRLSKVEQSAAKQATTLSDLQGNLSQVEQKADSNTATISSINKNAMQDRGVITDTKTSFDSLTQLGTYSIKASGLSMMPEQHYGTLVVSGSAGSGWLSQQFVADTTGNVYTRVFSNNAWSAWKQGGSQDAINQVKQTADSNSATIRNVQGDVNTLKQTATGVEAALADHDKNIHTLQADSKSLTDDMTDAQGNISKLQKTSTDLTSEMQDHDGRLSKVEQTAGTLTNEFADQQGHLNRVEQTANGTQQTVANQQGQINSIQTDVSGIHETITGQGNQITTINATLNGLDTKYEGVSGDLNNLKSQTQWVIVTSPVDLNNVITPCHEFLKGAVTNAPNESARWYLTVEGSEGDRVTQTVIADQSNNRYTRRLADSWSAWVRDATQTDVTALSGQITANSTQITQNKQAIALKADQSSVDNLSGEVSQNTAQLKVQADQISSKVSSEDFKTLDNKVGGAIAQIQKNSTAIDQTNQKISLKADQTEVDKIKNTATQNSSRLDVMAGEIQSKVTSTDVDNIINGKGYATTSTVQSLITQKAGTINESITSLDAKYNATVTQVQSLTASIDGLQSTVANKADKSQITQLSNVIQSKVSASDFNDLKDKTLWKSTDSIDLNTAVSQQKIFVKGGSNLPPGNYWWYVRVEPGYESRIVQYAVSDRNNLHYSRQFDGSNWSAWSQDATESEITQLRDDINLRVKSGDLLSQINLTANNTLIQSNKIYLDSSSTVFSGKAFIPSAAIVNLDADKINTGTLNTQMVSIGDDQTRLWARSNYLYLTGKDQGDAYNMRIGGDKIEFVTTEIPNNAPYMDGITPMYQIAYDGDTKSRLKIRSFNRLTGSNEFPIEMYDSVNISKDEIDLAANNQMKLSIRDDGVHVRRSLFFENGGGTGVFGGFTRADNSNIVEFSTGDNNGENFRIDCGARFMQYVYINGNARAQQWLTNSALSKKMNIRKLDLQTALNKIRQDDQYLYEYKRNVAQGIHDPQASFIIDDVHDVAHYSVPREFIDNTGKYREPSVELAYLIAAFQAIDKQVQAQQAEIKILKEQLQHE